MYRYRGSKETLAPPILALMPQTRHFLECFAGSARVTHALLRDGRFANASVTISDHDFVVACFWQTLRDNCDDLQGAVYEIVMQQRTHEQRRGWYFNTRTRLRDVGAFSCRVRRSAAFFVCSYVSKYGSSQPQEAYLAGGWLSERELGYKLDRMRSWSDAFQRVEILHADYRATVKKYASRYTTFYMDPPYQLSRSDSIYWGGMDHNAFLRFMSETDARWILTYDARSRLRTDWLKSRFWIDSDIGGIYARTGKPRTEFIARWQAPSPSALRIYNTLKRRSARKFGWADV